MAFKIREITFEMVEPACSPLPPRASRTWNQDADAGGEGPGVRGVFPRPAVVCAPHPQPGLMKIIGDFSILVLFRFRHFVALVGLGGLC